MSKRWCAGGDSDAGRVKAVGVSSKHNSRGAFPACWKTMRGVVGRFSLMKQVNLSECLPADATFCCNVLAHAYPMHFRHDVPPPKPIKKRTPSKHHGKRNYYDLTVSDTDDEPEEKEEVIVLIDHGVSVSKLQEMVTTLETKNIRIVEIEQLQNTHSHTLQRVFMEANELNGPCEIVFHGTDSAAVDGIVGEGLRSMYSNRSLFGRGTYVSRSFEVARFFATADQNGIKHIIVAMCQVGLVKQVQGDTAQESFYSDSSDGSKKILYNTKEVKHHEYLIIGNDSQLSCHALLKVQDMRPPTADSSQKQAGSSVNTLASIWLKKITHDVIQSFGNGAAAGGAGNLGLAANNMFVANMHVNPPPAGSAASSQKSAIDFQANADAFDADVRLLKAEKLRSCQAPLPDTSIDLLKYQKKGKLIRKGQTIVLSSMSKSNSDLENKTAVVKLIVQECSEKGYPIVFMVELLEPKLFPAITKANQQREKKYKQTGYSRYGDQMREHYLLCKFGQITAKT